MRGHFFCGNLQKTNTIPAYTFKRHEKLKSRKLTDRLFSKGKNFNAFPFRVLYLISSTGFNVPEGKAFRPGCPVQFGIGVGTRHFKKAVQRNRIKRLVREAWRLQKHILYEAAAAQHVQAAVFFMFTDKTLPDHTTIIEKMNIAVLKMQKIISETKS